MSEIETAGADAGETEATEGEAATPEQIAERAAFRTMARALCRVDGAGGAEMRKRWTEGRKEYLAKARKLVRALAKENASVVTTAKATADDDAADDADA